MPPEHKSLSVVSNEHKESAPSDLRERKPFEWYYNLLFEEPKVARNAHQRVADMFEYYGTTEREQKNYVDYHLASKDPINDGENVFYGENIHRAIHKFVNKVKSGARGLGPEKRIKLLLGPVGSGKSDFDKQVREYFQHYTRTDDGKMYTFEWVDLCSVIDDQDPADDVMRSPMDQDPIVLLPKDQRKEVLDEMNSVYDSQYHLDNRQSLDPLSEFLMDKLLENYDEDLEKVLENHVRIVRLVADENKRRCIETFEPKDKKNQDETELTGDVNYSKIAVYGESDPRAFDYSGAFCNANRGIFSGEELLKLQREFLYDFLHATQEQTIKPKNNPRVDIDQVIVGRTNMPEYIEKKGDEKMEAFNDRTKRIDFPYTLEYSEESKIYRKILRNASIPEVSIEPHTLEMAGLFGVLTRLEEPDADDVNLLEKAKAYNGENSDIDVDKLQEEAESEGMFGVSARFIGDEIAEVIVDKIEEGEMSLMTIAVLNYLEENLELHGSIPEEKYDDYYRYIELTREEYVDRAVDDVRHALAYNTEEIQELGKKYMDNVMAYIDDDTVTDELTGEEQEPDEKFMRSVEKKLEIPTDRKDDFRQEISNWVSRRARSGERFNPQDNDRLRRALEQKIWEDKRHNINFQALISAGEDDEEEHNDWIMALQEQGYSEEGAKKVLEYAGAEVARTELEDEQS